MAAMAAEEASDDLCLPPRAESGRLAGAGNVFDHTGPLHQQIVHGIIDAIQLGA
jgi:hypothetical protein